MSTPWILYRLYSLDASSPDFLRVLCSLIRYDEKEQYLIGLQGSELARMVDFLDKALSVIPITDNVARECLNKLQTICGRHATLPSSYIVSGEIVRVGDGPIALGAIADVWEGSYRGKKVSVKSLGVAMKNYQATKKSFFEDAIMWKRLRHPNIVPFIGVTTTHPFIGVTTHPLQIVSEWMPNGTLVEFIEKNPGAKRVNLLLDVAEGLEYLHTNCITHGNLKGPNILVNHDGHACLTNFEFVSIVRGMNSATQANEYTAAWAAPEILVGANTITREADVFAFGMVVVEVFTGKCPFSEFTTPAITSKIMGGERPARPQEARERGLTNSVWDVTVRYWYQDPAQRPTMMEVVGIARECYRMVTLWARITDIPIKLLINNILSFCEAKDVLSLSCTNKFFANAIKETFWRQRLVVDYNFTGSETARTSDWKLIYQRFRHQRVFVWGCHYEGPLGLLQSPKATFPDVPFPVELHLPGVDVVSLAASCWACHALGADGSIYVWGALTDLVVGEKDADFSNPCATAWTPLKLQLPAPTCAISCGYKHVMTLDTNSMVWNFLSWGRPFQLVSPSLDCSSLETTPIQVECGWQFSAVLTGSGDVYMWWPYSSNFESQYKEAMAKLNKGESTKAIVPNGGIVISCHTWEINMDPVKLPILPDLPNLPGTGLPEEECRKETKLVRIAGLDNSLIGLTNKGHVLMIDGVGKEQPTGTWYYLPNYSEIDKVKKHPAFQMTTDNNGQERPLQVALSSDTMLITHVSACWGFFFAYSSSMVLQGESNTTPTMLPTIILELQNRSVISVVHGHSHFGALTSSGKLLTWGKYFGGALGLGDPTKLPVGSPGGYMKEEQQLQAQVNELPPDVVVPSEVRFDHGLKAKGRVERYCLAVAASGYSTAALVVDLKGDVPLEDLNQHFAEMKGLPFACWDP